MTVWVASDPVGSRGEGSPNRGVRCADSGEVCLLCYMATSNVTASRIGVRRRKQVEHACACWIRIPDSCFRHPYYFYGVLACYRWVLGLSRISPTTATPTMGASVPCSAQLLAEEQAAHLERQYQLVSDPLHLEYTLGVYAVLAWTCGHSDSPPCGRILHHAHAND